MVKSFVPFKHIMRQSVRKKFSVAMKLEMSTILSFNKNRLCRNEFEIITLIYFGNTMGAQKLTSSQSSSRLSKLKLVSLAI